MKAKKEKVVDKQKQLKNEISVLAALFFSFNLFFFAPMDFYYSNIDQISIGKNNIIFTLLTATAIAFIGLFFLFRLTKGKVNTFFLALFTGVGLAMYIQGNYLNSGMGTLDGHEYKPSAAKICINLFIWAVIIALPFLIAKFNKKAFPNFIKFLSFFIVCIQFITIAYLKLKYDSVDSMIFFEKDEEANITKIISTQDQFLYSKDENFIVIIPDEYDSRCFDHALESDPSLFNELDGFVYYENTTGMYRATDQAIPYIFTGEEPSQPFEYKNLSFFDTVSKDMKVNIYSHPNISPPEIFDKYADNYIEKKIGISDLANISKMFYKITLFKYMPEAFKGNFFVYSSDINTVLSSVQGYDYDNLAFYNRLQKDLYLTDEKCFKFFYLQGLHDPRNVSPDLKRVENWSITADEQAVAVNKILLKYLDQLKSYGVYENSTIIIMADHGLRASEKGLYPTLLIKKAGSAGTPLQISSAPISHKDIFPTLMYLAGEDPEGETVFDIPEDQPRERYYASHDQTIPADMEKPNQLSEWVR